MSKTSQNTSPRPEGMQRARPGGGAGPIHRIEKPRDTRKAILRLVKYLQPFKTSLLLVCLLVLGYSILSLLGPYLLGVTIDNFIGMKQVDGLLKMAIWMLIIYLSSSAFQAISNWIMAAISQKALQGLRRDLFNHLQKLSLSFFDRNPAGELMSRLTNDIDAINQAVSQNVVALISGVLSLAGILIAMFLLNLWMSLTTLIVVPLMFWFANFVARYTRRGFQRLQKQLGVLNGTIEETISGQRVVKAFLRKESMIEKFRQENEEVYHAGIYANTYALLLMPLTNVLGNFFVIVLAGIGGWLTLQGLASVGIIATFIAYGRQFIQPLRQLANIFNAIQAALAGAERVFDILDTPIELTDQPGAVAYDIQGEVKFEGVDFAYVPGVPVIKEMDLHASPGETIALVGPTGAGKTTIINLLTRFYDIQSGSIQIDGIDIRQLRKEDLRRQLGLVLQDTFLFTGTVMENIRYGRLDASDEECIQAACMADADHFIRQLPRGYQTILSERGSNLSQGQRQLLTIARAILADPAILILDEATSSVDTRTESRIQKALLRLMQGRTSFVIAHRLSTIRDADKVVVINDGRIIEQGKHNDLLNVKGFYFNLYMSQFKGHTI